MTAPSDSGNVAAAVAQRLVQLGRNPDFVTPAALAALTEACGGSPRRLQVLLTQALFVASTESAPSLDASHVIRAAEQHASAPSVGGEGPSSRPRSTGHAAWVDPPQRERQPLVPRPDPPPRQHLAASLAATAMLLSAGTAAMVLWPGGQTPEQYPPTSAVLPSPSPAPRPVAAPEPTPAPSPRPASAPKPTPPAAPSASAKPAPAMPSPPRLTQPLATPPATARAEPPAAVFIDYARRDPTARARAASVAVALQKAGIEVVGYGTARPHQPATVHYYFPADRQAAERVQALLGKGWLVDIVPMPRDRDAIHPGMLSIALP
jgi:hypothetical protein